MEYHELIKKICEEEKIDLKFLSDDWVKVLEKDGNVHYIQGYKFDLNGHAIASILDDKGLFYDLVTSFDLPIIEHKVLFSDYNKYDAINYFKKNNNTLIVKGNLGTCGKEVFLVKDEQELFETIDNLFLKQFSISLCPYYDILHEYRVIVLDKKVRVVYGKERPEIIGNGKNTTYELACMFNEFYLDNKNLLLNADIIPQKGEKILLNYQFNLSKGAKMFLDIDDRLKEEITSLALEVANKTGITFGSIDIIHTRDNKLLVMEANSGVMMDNYIKQDEQNGSTIAYNLYRDAIKLMFDKK